MSQIDLRRVKLPGTELPDKKFWPKLFVYLDCFRIRVLCIEYGFDAYGKEYEKTPESYEFDIGINNNELNFKGSLENILYMGMCNGHLILANYSEVHYFNLYGLIT